MRILDDLATETKTDETISQKVEELLEKVITSPKYYKAVHQFPTGEYRYFVGDSIETNVLEEMLGSRYLNIQQINPDARDSLAYIPNRNRTTEFTTTIPYLHVRKIDVYRSSQIVSSKYQLVPCIDSDTSPITPETADIIYDAKIHAKQQSEALKMRLDRYKHLLDGTEGIYHRNEWPTAKDEAETAYIKLKIFNKLRKVDELTPDYLLEIKNDVMKFRQEQTKLDAIRVGVEIEIPYTGYAGKRIDKLNGTKYVAFPEMIACLSELGIPTEADKQGEAALPPSRSCGLEEALIRELRDSGMLPDSLSIKFTYSMHVNIELPMWVQETYREKNIPLLDDMIHEMGCYFGLAFASSKRHDSGAYYDTAEIKGITHDDPDSNTRRIEFRALEYNPDADNAEIFENIRACTVGMLLATQSLGEGTETRKQFLLFLQECRSTYGYYEGFSFSTQDTLSNLASDRNIVVIIKSSITKFAKYVKENVEMPAIK